MEALAAASVWGCEPDACGCADDRAVSEWLGQGDDRCFRERNVGARAAGLRPTVTPADYYEILELEDVSSKVGITVAVADDEGERAALDPDKALDLQEARIRLG
jgi:hypothetical protein